MVRKRITQSSFILNSFGNCLISTEVAYKNTSLNNSGNLTRDKVSYNDGRAKFDLIF